MYSKTLLDISSRITPADRHVHLVHRFLVPRNTRQLRIDFAYSPKLLQDEARQNTLVRQAVDRYMEPELREVAYTDPDYLVLQNLLTVSLDDPAGFRGAAHRANKEQIIIVSESTATPGFLAGPLPAGLWELTVSLHEVVTDKCQFELQVQAAETEGADGL
ncbi:hypothetical protein GCM10010912_16990 [Paenibacillus albidus]|uniref:Uncharacterized protein n=1 Tax=Paenibacillus albidus TaxID=2041023 RepID=A0A917C503_9BACL|nr:hypothetical protein [Paenibacillus albidus]GGF72463.1 hypothetical protein GCM10010912_16990 [Paenibacillus albidus]